MTMYEKILKANPYHDENGRFSTRDKAKHSSAVENYRTGHFRGLKSTQSGIDQKDYSSDAEALQKELLSSKVGKKMTVFRGVRGSYAEKLLGLKVGDTFGDGDSRFISTDKSKDVADFYKNNGSGDQMVMEIRLKATDAGKRIGKGKGDDNEEVVLPAGTKFKVVEVKPVESKEALFGTERYGHIVLEVVPPTKRKSDLEAALGL